MCVFVGVCHVLSKSSGGNLKSQVCFRSHNFENGAM
jgi:hypothetical protein